VSSGVSACGFGVVHGLQGMADWPGGSPFPHAGAVFVRADGRGQGPGGARPHRGAGGVLDAGGCEPIIDAPRGKAPRGG
jgi:hypothetical protein